MSIYNSNEGLQCCIMMAVYWCYVGMIASVSEEHTAFFFNNKCYCTQNLYLPLWHIN